MMEKVWFEENKNNVRALLKMLGKLQEEKESGSTCDDHYDLYLEQIKTLEDRITELCEKPIELKQDIIGNITKEIKEVYPNMEDKQAYGYIRDALSSKTIVEQIVNFTYFCKKR